MSAHTFPATPPARSDIRTIALVGLAHGTSHFFHLLLPPLFPLFRAEFGLSYAELGLLVTIFFVISGIGQAAAGFLVDRVGARPVLFAALACFAAAGFAASAAQGFDGLALAAALAGVGNAPFHPVDFTILNRRVSPARLGHAFSVHGITGNLGWAAAPAFQALVGALFGSWRAGLAGAGVWALLVLAVLAWQRDWLADGEAVAPAAAPSGRSAQGAGLPSESSLAFLRLPSVWLCFSFFFWSTCALSAIQSFASPSLSSLYGLAPAATAFVVSGYMLFGALGMFIGGFLASRTLRLERLIGACLMVAAALLVAVGSGLLPAALAVGVASLAGLGTGLANPSRDMLIRRAAPPGATGRVYGMVYSGLDLGFAVAAPVFGALVDHGHPQGVFHGAALMLAAGVVSATLVGWRVRPAATPRGAPA